ncbi:MAG: hypothetical protein LBP34_09470 [Flavobacteriaceae bacterium]|nr:hypothetical protein [Flavobacteriaceae bacterium]
MRTLYVTALLTTTFIFYSCKNDKNTTPDQPDQEIKQDSVANDNTSAVEEINLDLVKSEIPFFDNPEADDFVAQTKKYFEEIAEATKKGDSDKVLELQLQAVDIDLALQKVKNKLNAEQKKQLTDWYMKLVNAASE